MGIVNFEPQEPINISVSIIHSNRRILKSDVDKFWLKADSKIKDAKGIYIFGIQMPNGILPVYVGKTHNSFFKEVFADRNLIIYNEEIIKYKRNYLPFIQCLVYKQKPGVVAQKVILSLEKHIIMLAKEKNPDLANSRNTKNPNQFFITGLGGGRGNGAPTKSGKFFKKMMNF